MQMTLAAARVNKRLSQKEAAKRLEISTDTLRNYEQGKTFPSVVIIKKMETLYEISYNDLIFLPTNNG